MLALQEFGITEYSSNFTLCEVKVDVSAFILCPHVWRNKLLRFAPSNILALV